jgi:DNA-directed RNA polymerase subunit M/transcription elongation factor TFIIS
MSNKDIQKLKKKKAEQKRETKYAGPIKTEATGRPIITEVYQEGSVRDRVAQLLDLPTKIVSIIFDTKYDSGNGLMLPLFPTAGIEIPITEITELIRVYDLYRGIHTDTGREIDIAVTGPTILETDVDSELRGLENSNNIPDTGRHRSENRPNNPGQEEIALAKFEHYVKGLAKKKELKVKKNILLRDDTVFEAPALEALRQEEKIKINLSTRKRKPIKGIVCGRCKNDECHIEERNIRSGDEGAVVFYTCDTCDNEWRVG